MRLTDRIFLVGSGQLGFDMTDARDCHVYAVDGGAEWALIDCGAGLGLDAILSNAKRDGLEPGRLSHLLLTHKHADHAAGAGNLKSMFPHLAVHASPHTEIVISTADEVASGVELVKRLGGLPVEFQLPPCRVDHRVIDGDEITVGDLSLCVIESPGHCDGHLSFLVEHGGRRSLFAGDAVLWQGQVMLQNVPDCSLQQQMQTILKLETYRIDSLLPGHLSLSLNDGQRHVAAAAVRIRDGRAPLALL